MIAWFQTVMWEEETRRASEKAVDSEVWHTEMTKCRKIKAAGVLEFSTEYQ